MYGEVNIGKMNPFLRYNIFKKLEKVQLRKKIHV